jgi:uncharacterized protein (DUF2237 family)
MDTCLITIEQLLSSPCSSSHILFSLLSKFLTFAFTLFCFRFAIPPLQIPTLKPGDVWLLSGSRGQAQVSTNELLRKSVRA